MGDRVDKSLLDARWSLPRAATPLAQLSDQSSTARLLKNSLPKLSHVAATLKRAALNLRVSIHESAASILEISITLDSCCCRSPIATWGCFATVHCFFLRLVPAFSSLLQAREVARLATAPKPNVGAPRCRWKRGGILGRLSRPLALQPALPAGHTARTRGIPRRVAVLGLRHSAQDVGDAQSTVTRSQVFGKQDGSLVPRPLHQKGPVSYR